MFCSQCGAPITAPSRFCPSCGAPTESVAPDVQRKRPTAVTILAVVKFVSAFVWLGLGLLITAAPRRTPEDAFVLVFAAALIGLGLLAIACGWGLLTLRPYGRYLQIGFSTLGLVVFPFQTIISILILVYMFQGGMRVLFAGAPVASLSPDERRLLQTTQATSGAAVAIAIVVAVPVGILLMGLVAAIAIPNFLNAVDRGKQKRTMADLRSIGVALEAYADEHDAYPSARTNLDLRSALEPAHIKSLPMIDGWGNAFQVDVSAEHYRIYSKGKDGAGDDCAPQQTTTYDDEICLVDGQFVRSPTGAAPGP